MANETVTPAHGGREKVKNIIDAVTEMQRYSISDGQGAFTSKMFAWDQVIEFFSIGFKIFFAGFLVCLFLVPLAVATSFNVIEVYGGIPTLYDKLFVFGIAFSMSFGAIAILWQTEKFSMGPLTYKMLKTLYSGAIMSAIIKGLVLFIGYQFVASLITPELVFSHLNSFLALFPQGHIIAASGEYDATLTIVNIIKPIFRISAFIMLIFSIVTTLLLLGLLYKAKKRMKLIVKRKNYMEN